MNCTSSKVISIELIQKQKKKVGRKHLLNKCGYNIFNEIIQSVKQFPLQCNENQIKFRHARDLNTTMTKFLQKLDLKYNSPSM